MKKPLIIITGPTASGKTGIAIKIANELKTEIISADSMQIYKGIETIAATPTKEEQNQVKHHLISFKNLNEEYSVSDFVNDASKIIDSISDKIPIICGGTGLYISSLINNIDFSENSSNAEIRKRLENELAELGPEALHNRLKEMDPEAAEWIHPNNKVRVIRALEIIETTGKTFTRYRIDAAKNEEKYDALVFALNFRNRETLYNRINKRVDAMLSNSMEAEAREALLNNPSKTAMAAIGLKEFSDYFLGLSDYEDIVEKIKQGSRNYAKRQITWIKRIPSVNWVFYEDFNSEDEMLYYITEKIKEHFNEEEK